MSSKLFLSENISAHKEEALSKALETEKGREALAKCIFLALSTSKNDFGTAIRWAKLDKKLDQEIRKYWKTLGLDWDNKYFRCLEIEKLDDKNIQNTSNILST